MSRVEEIQSAIVSLSPEDYARLRQWLAERDWEQWDREIAQDAASGKLDFLRQSGFAIATSLMIFINEKPSQVASSHALWLVVKYPRKSKPVF